MSKRNLLIVAAITGLVAAVLVVIAVKTAPPPSMPDYDLRLKQIHQLCLVKEKQGDSSYDRCRKKRMKKLKKKVPPRYRNRSGEEIDLTDPSDPASPMNPSHPANPAFQN